MFDLIKNLFKPKADIKKLLEEGGILIDVRTKTEFESGYIKGSINIPLDKLKSKTLSLKQLNKPIVTVCRTGSRSGIAKNILNAAGLKAYNGGAWSKLQKKI